MPAAREVPELGPGTSEGVGAVRVHRGTHVARSEAFLPSRMGSGPSGGPTDSSRRNRAAAASPQGSPTSDWVSGAPAPSSARASLSPPGSAHVPQALWVGKGAKAPGRVPCCWSYERRAEEGDV